MGDGNCYVVCYFERGASCDEHVEVGVFFPEVADVTFHLESGSVDGSREHAGGGVVSQEGCVGLCLYLGQEVSMLVHGVESELHSWGDGSSKQTTSGNCWLIVS